MRFVNEPTEVDTRFQADGRVRPRRFTWRQTWLDVSDVGRQWVDPDGRHVLVMAQASWSGAEGLPGGGHTFELLLERESLSWRIVRAPADVAVA